MDDRTTRDAGRRSLVLVVVVIRLVEQQQATVE